MPTAAVENGQALKIVHQMGALVDHAQHVDPLGHQLQIADLEEALWGPLVDLLGLLRDLAYHLDSKYQWLYKKTYSVNIKGLEGRNMLNVPLF